MAGACRPKRSKMNSKILIIVPGLPKTVWKGIRLRAKRMKISFFCPLRVTATSIRISAVQVWATIGHRHFYGGVVRCMGSRLRFGQNTLGHPQPLLRTACPPCLRVFRIVLIAENNKENRHSYLALQYTKILWHNRVKSFLSL